MYEPRGEHRHARAASASSACASRSTISAPATRASPTCAACRCTSSRSTAPSCARSTRHAADEAIVRAIATLGRTLGIAVAAEGRRERGAARAPARARLRRVAGAPLQRAARRRAASRSSCCAAMSWRSRGLRPSARIGALVGAHFARAPRPGSGLRRRHAPRRTRCRARARAGSRCARPRRSTPGSRSSAPGADRPIGCRSRGRAADGGARSRVDVRIALAAVADQHERQRRIGAQDRVDRARLVVLRPCAARNRAASAARAAAPAPRGTRPAAHRDSTGSSTRRTPGSRPRCSAR